jgi:hypothetical protein
MSVPVARYDFPAEKFPVTIEALHPETRAVVWWDRIEKPEFLTTRVIPPLARMLGHRVTIRITFGDGEVQET